MKKFQHGFSLVTAIFLLVVLSFLGTAMMMFSTNQSMSAAQDVLGSRAYHAARAGIEWAAYGVTNSTAGTVWPGCASGATFSPANNPLGGTLAPFSVSVTCTSSSADEGTGTTEWLYNITSAASGVNGVQPGQAEYVERVITAKMVR